MAEGERHDRPERSALHHEADARPERPAREREAQALPERPVLRRAIRQELRGAAPELRVIAEDILAEASRIDLLAVGPEGEVVAVRIGDGSNDLELFTRALADRAWLAPRVADWRQLAPELDLEPEAGARAVLVCPDFAPETRAAAGSLPAGTVELVRFRCLRARGRLLVLLDRGESAGAERATAHPPPLEAAFARPGRAAPGGEISCFRTGLSESDLRGDPALLSTNG